MIKNMQRRENEDESAIEGQSQKDQAVAQPWATLNSFNFSSFPFSIFLSGN